MSRGVYSVLLAILALLYRLKVWLRSRHEPDYQEELQQRFRAVCLPHLNAASAQRPILIHAVSVGESNAAEPLIRSLLAENRPVIVTNTTRTGRARIRQLFATAIKQGQLVSLFLPLDQPALVTRLLDTYQPALVGLIETELWPVLIAELNRRQIPVILFNARLSEKSAQGYARLGNLTRHMIGQLSCIAAQDQATAERFIQLGALPARVVITGSLKYDLSPPAALLTQAQQLADLWHIRQRPVLVAASTHEPEERQILAVFKQIHTSYPDLLLILVPRHPERFGAVASLIQAMGWPLVKRSRQQAADISVPVYLADSMGELWCWYALAAHSVNGIAFVGGSLSETGGHNPLEPARLGLPVIMGPHTFNFTDIVDRLATAGGLVQVTDNAGLAQTAMRWLQQPQLAQQTGQAAQQVVLQNQGALARQITLLNRYSGTVNTPV